MVRIFDMIEPFGANKPGIIHRWLDRGKGKITMAIANKKAVFHCDVKKVWDTVTSLDDYGWRSDLSRIEVLEPGRKFVEYTKDGIATTFTITLLEPMKRYEFDMENENIHGHWAGLFFSEDGKTLIDFTEDVKTKKILLKPLISLYLKKQQAAYVADLRKALGA